LGAVSIGVTARRSKPNFAFQHIREGDERGSRKVAQSVVVIER